MREFLESFPDADIRKIDLSTGEVVSSSSGLSKLHNSTNKNLEYGQLEVYEGGGLVVAKAKNHPFKGFSGGRRGKICGFSKNSRRRLIRKMAMIDRGTKPLFVTLTYPGQYSKNSKDWKYDLKKFFRRLTYNHPRSCGIWKLEPQKRGAPHYHLLIWGVSYEDLRVFVPQTWYEVVSSCDIRHLRAGTRVEKLYSWRGVMSYASKYLGKVVENNPDWDLVGRYWGVFMRDLIPWAELKISNISRSQLFRAIRYFRRYANLKSFSYYSLSLFCNQPEDWNRAVHHIPIRTEQTEQNLKFIMNYT